MSSFVNVDAIAAGLALDPTDDPYDARERALGRYAYVLTRWAVLKTMRTVLAFVKEVQKANAASSAA